MMRGVLRDLKSCKSLDRITNTFSTFVNLNAS